MNPLINPNLYIGIRVVARYEMLISHRCWDGKNLDSADHQSHMYNTVDTDYFNNAPKCPSSHP